MPESIVTELPHYVRIEDNTRPSELPHYRQVIAPKAPWVGILVAMLGLAFMMGIIALVANQVPRA